MTFGWGEVTGSLRSKRFHGVWKQRKTEGGTGFSVFFPREKWGESQKTKEGGGGGERRNRNDHGAK